MNSGIIQIKNHLSLLWILADFEEEKIGETMNFFKELLILPWGILHTVAIFTVCFTLTYNQLKISCILLWGILCYLGYLQEIKTPYIVSVVLAMSPCQHLSLLTYGRHSTTEPGGLGPWWGRPGLLRV